MKKILWIVFTAFLIYGTSHAATYDFQIGSGDKVVWDGAHAGQGGEFGFSVLGDDYSWSTFCAELEQNMYAAGTSITVSGLSDHNTSYNTTGDGILTDTVAWLYWNFSEGTLLNYNGSTDNQEDLQKLIWNGLGYDGYSARSYQADRWFAQAAFEVNNNGWTNDGRVSNLTIGRESGRTHRRDSQ